MPPKEGNIKLFWIVLQSKPANPYWHIGVCSPRGQKIFFFENSPSNPKFENPIVGLNVVCVILSHDIVSPFSEQGIRKLLRTSLDMFVKKLRSLLVLLKLTQPDGSTESKALVMAGVVC